MLHWSSIPIIVAWAAAWAYHRIVDRWVDIEAMGMLRSIESDTPAAGAVDRVHRRYVGRGNTLESV